MSDRMKIGLGLLAIATLGLWVFVLDQSPTPRGDVSFCEGLEHEPLLEAIKRKGVQRVQPSPSLSNTLWVFVGPTWQELPLADKKALDEKVRCLALSINEEGEPTWRSAYYDDTSGNLVALSSRQYGFRLK